MSERADASGRLTIGVLTNTLNGTIPEDEWRGYHDAAVAHDVNLLGFPGVSLRAPEGREAEVATQSNIVFDLVPLERVDGVIIHAGALGANADRETLHAFCRQYSHLPHVIVEGNVADAPRVMIGDYEGVRQIMHHLIEVHGARRIAFVRGPHTHPGAEERFRAYTDTLIEHGFPFDQSLISEPAPVWWPPPLHICAALLDRDPLDIDAVVAASDGLAMGMLRMLQARGIRVPEDVALMGFDDASESKSAAPPMTTIDPDHYQKGYQSLALLMRVLRGEDDAARVAVTPRLVVRRSCGCLSQAVLDAGSEVADAERAPAEAAPARPFAEAFAERVPRIRQDITEHLASETRRVLGPDWDTSWLHSLAEALTGTVDAGVFLAHMDGLMRQAATAEHSLRVWHRVLSTTRRHVIPLIAEPALVLRAEQLWRQAHILVGDVMRWARDYRQYRANLLADTLDQIGRALLTSFDIDKLMHTLAEELPRLGIPTGYLALYEDAHHPTTLARLLLAYQQGARVWLPVDKPQYATPRLLPDDLWPRERRWTLVVAPCYFGQEQLGFGLFEMGPDTASTFETLRGQISSALKGALLVQQVENRAMQLQTASEVAQAVGSILQPETMIRQVVELVRERFDLYYVGLFLIDHGGEWTEEPGKWAVLRAGTGEAGREMLARGHKLEVGGESMIGACVVDRRARIALDVGDAAARFDNPFLPDTHSEMALPLVARDQAIGALTIQSSAINAFTEEDVAVLQTMASQVAIAIEDARLLAETQRRAAELAGLNELGQALTTHRDIGDVVLEIYDGVQQLLTTSDVYLFLYDDESDAYTLALEAVTGGVTRPFTPYRANINGLIPYLVRSKHPLLIRENVEGRLLELGLRRPEFQADRTVLSLMGAPLMLGERVMGAILAYDFARAGAFDEHSRDLMVAIAGRAAVALENARLLQQTQSALQEMEATQRRYQQRVWSEYLRIAPVTRYESRQVDAPVLGERVLPEVQRAVEDRKPVVLSGDAGPEGHSALVVPSALRGGVVGVVGVHDDDTERVWTEDQIALVEAVAERMAMAADNLRLLDATQRRAAREQLTREITNKMRRATSMNTLVQTAVQEMAAAFGISDTFVQLKVLEEQQDNPGQTPAQSSEEG